MRKTSLVLCCVLVFCWASNQSHGAGFLIYEHGAAAMAMAGAFVAVANDPSAIWHNPAGIAFLKGTRFSVGTTLIRSTSSLELTNWPVPSQKNWEQVKQTFYPSSVYFTQSLGDKVTFGFGFFSPYGLGAKWAEEDDQARYLAFPLRYLGYKDDLKTFFLNPAIGVKLTDQFALGLGVSYIHSTVSFNLVRLADLGPYGTYDVPAALEGTGHSFSWNAGLLYRGENFSFGLNYRSAFTIDFEGDLSLDTSLVPPPLQPYVPTDAAGATSFKCPHILGAGIAFNLTKQFLLTADIHYVLWTEFDELVVTFDNPLVETLELSEEWKDAFTYRAGLQYMVNEDFALRAGIIYDTTPQPAKSVDPLLPDANRFALTAGFGYKIGSFVVDLAYQYEKFNDRKAPNRSDVLEAYQIGQLNLGEGIYKTTAHLLGISLSFVF